QHQYQPLSVWEQCVSIFAVNSGLFDEVLSTNIKAAQKALLTRLWTDSKTEMEELNKGANKLEADSELGKLITKVATSVAKGFEG
ncbi:MAG: F0F1 ATP synthase subunit alpha, partial [Candidatus Saccharimonas sp.]